MRPRVEQAAVQLEPQLRQFGEWLLGFLAGIGGAVITTVLSLIAQLVPRPLPASG